VLPAAQAVERARSESSEHFIYKQILLISEINEKVKQTTKNQTKQHVTKQK